MIHFFGLALLILLGFAVSTLLGIHSDWSYSLAGSLLSSIGLDLFKFEWVLLYSLGFCWLGFYWLGLFCSVLCLFEPFVK